MRLTVTQSQISRCAPREPDELGAATLMERYVRRAYTDRRAYSLDWVRLTPSICQIRGPYARLCVSVGDELQVPSPTCHLAD